MQANRTTYQTVGNSYQAAAPLQMASASYPTVAGTSYPTVTANFGSASVRAAPTTQYVNGATGTAGRPITMAAPAQRMQQTMTTLPTQQHATYQMAGSINAAGYGAPQTVTMAGATQSTQQVRVGDFVMSAEAYAEIQGNRSRGNSLDQAFGGVGSQGIVREVPMNAAAVQPERKVVAAAPMPAIQQAPVFSSAALVPQQTVVTQAAVFTQAAVTQTVVATKAVATQAVVSQAVATQQTQPTVVSQAVVQQAIVQQVPQQMTVVGSKPGPSPSIQEAAKPVQQVLVEEIPRQKSMSNMDDAMLNQAFVFVKPHAVGELSINTTRDMLMNCGITIAGEGDLTSDIIEERRLVDKHHPRATVLKPDQAPVDNDLFQEVFGHPWHAALPTAYNAADAQEALQSSAAEIGELWNDAKEQGKYAVISDDLHVGLLEKPGCTPIYVINAEFMHVRKEFVAAGSSIHWFAVEWDERSLSWADFRSQVLGPADPSIAPSNSIRGMIFANWQQLGLASEPDVTNNGVHASASPLEALYERMNWLGMPCAEDVFGSYLLQLNVPMEIIDAFAVNPLVNLPDEKVGSVWDHLQDTDASTCVDKFVNIVNLNLQ